MVKPFAEGSIVMEATTTEPTEYLQFDPDGLPGEFWLHRREEFDPDMELGEIIDYYSLPESSSYTVRIVDVPADVNIRFGSVAANHGRSGGGDLVDPIEYDEIPTAWVQDTQQLSAFLEGV